MVLNSNCGDVFIYASTIDKKTVSDIQFIANANIGQSNVVAMPNAYTKLDCVKGITMHISDKIVPHLLGEDIGCGVLLLKTSIRFLDYPDEALSDIIHTEVIKYNNTSFNFDSLHCWNKLSKDTQDEIRRTINNFGYAPHFVEAYENGYLAVHCGCSDIGRIVARHYSLLAIEHINKLLRKLSTKNLQPAELDKQQKYYISLIANNLCYLTKKDADDYLHDVSIIQDLARINRRNIATKITMSLCGIIYDQIDSTHNSYSNGILRNGAISAKKDERCVILLNSHDGILVCKGKGNEDWNCSAPAGAGNNRPKHEALNSFSSLYLEDGISEEVLCTYKSALDEAPIAYKDCEEIMKCITPTVDVINHLWPIYTFKIT